MRMIKNGIEVCEDKCLCGRNLRLHSYVFNENTSQQSQKFYIDCTNGCGRVSQWHESPDKAVEEFDKEYQQKGNY